MISDPINQLTNKPINEFPTMPTLLTFSEKIPVILEHCELAVRMKGEKRGMLEMRRHLSSYVKGFDGAREMREKLVRVERLEEVKEILYV